MFSKIGESVMKNRYQKITGGVIAIIGYILSPVSWWNDLLVNFPLAYAFAMPFTLLSEKLFTPMLVVGYWLTNIIGIIMMRHGTITAVKGKSEASRSAMIIDLGIAVLYTIAMMVLVQLGIVKPLSF